MAGVYYALADFVSGGPILDLPIKEGAEWAMQGNRPDTLSCSVDMRDPDALALDLRASSEPKKTVLLARTEEDVRLAWGLVDDDREWDEDSQTLSITAKGIWGSWLGHSIIAPAAAKTATMVIDGEANPALDTVLTGLSLGSIGKRLVQQRQAWPGSPSPSTLILPADEVGTHERTYLFPSLKMIGSALTDLTNVERGPDFAFDAARAPDGISLVYTMRHGSEASPRLGSHVGIWPLGGESPITGLKVTDSAADFGTAAWLSGGKTAGNVMMARAVDDSLIAAGYPPLDFVDTARNDVTQQATLESYVRAAGAYASSAVRSLSFSVRADAKPGLGEIRPGDRVTLAVPKGHPYLTKDIEVRLTSIKGDEAGLEMQIGCEVIG